MRFTFDTKSSKEGLYSSFCPILWSEVFMVIISKKKKKRERERESVWILYKPTHLFWLSSGAYLVLIVDENDKEKET